ncbi:orotidine-5'-monophosphate decarboxylase [Leptospira ryugenii]|uniref:Orotidine-5'-phosphate decarboxylase n=1 Tax=Leptospira ryugenii TaxID=1917863 RepID=A0A2P2E4M9_9LEPT|nr:orotidine-5'-phosphate decarboxylase [Leptospira ryugenii]GBF51837.1 orotidine-5'-monophosphate decarboxylase [Leptospira ryugenii]
MNPSFYQKFIQRRDKLNSLLCIGLDPEWEKLPHSSLQSESPLVHFSESIIRNTHTSAVAWKPNIAFFERFGAQGYFSFERMIQILKDTDDSIPIVVDAKRGDLANTSKEYAKYFFQTLKADALTVNAYMGRDTLLPYLDAGGFIFILCLTSNPSSLDLQKLKISERDSFLYEAVSDFAADLEREFPKQVGIVMGGTHSSEIQNIRNRHPHLVFLVPGYGAQGASLKEIYRAGGDLCLINSSRGITLLSRESDFGSLAGKKAKEIQSEFTELRSTSV